MSRELFGIPNNWSWTILSDIGSIAAGGTPSTKDEINFSGDISWLTPADLSDYAQKYISHGRRNLSELGLKNSSAVLLPKGSVLFSSRAPIGYVVIAENLISTNQGFKNITVYKPIFNEYVYYYLKSSKSLAEKNASGTTFLEISARNFSNLPIPIPPPSEQHRIVAKLEELFTKLDAGIEALKKAQAQLKRYRQSMLKAAVEGKLTAEWREQHLPASLSLAQKGKKEFEPAEKLLEHIQDKRQNSHFTKKKLLQHIPFPKIPTSWKWTQVGQIADVKGGKRLPKGHKYSKKETNHPYIRVVDFDETTINTRELKYLNEDTHSAIKKYIILKKDVYISIAGSIGKCGTILEHLNGANLTENAARITNIIGLSNRLLSLFLNSPFLQWQINKMKTATSQPKLALFRIEQIWLPLPPKNEQVKIVDKIDQLLTIISNTNEDIYSELLRTQPLRHSILKSAFEGKLVPQDPNDLPASVLLERIKSEKVKSKKSKQMEIL